MAHLNGIFSISLLRPLAALFGECLLGLALVAGAPPALVKPKPRPVLPDPSATVTVTGLQMRIPPPPLSSSDAASRSLSLLGEIRRTISFLDVELKRLGVAQAQELAQLKADPGLATAGMDTPLFAKLYASSKDLELSRLETTYRAEVGVLQAELDKAVEKDDALMGLFDPKAWMRGHMPEDEDVIKLDPGVPQMAKENASTAKVRRRLSTATATSTLDNFLGGYVKIAATYSLALEAHQGQLEVLLRVPEPEFTASTRVLARLLQLQFYKSYRALTVRHKVLWEGAAKVGNRRLKAELDHEPNAQY